MVGLSLAFVTMAPRAADACTAFQVPAGGTSFVAKAYDWHMGQGLVIINKKGLAKRAIVLDSRDKAATWTSQHASVTFNQYGRELPCSGMNDAGLVIEALWLDRSVFPPKDARPTLNELQWIQHALDRYGSVTDLVAHVHDVRVSLAYGRVHYFAADRQGQTAIIEHLNGKTVVTTGPAVRTRALTNHTYADSLAFLRTARKSPGNQAGQDSLPRFVTTSQLIIPQPKPSADPVARAFDALQRIKTSNNQWNLVYDPVRLSVWFRTTSQRLIKQVDLKRFAASCGSPTQVLDIDTPFEGDVSGLFDPYTEVANRRLVTTSLAGIVDQLPPGTAESLIAYPRSLRCGGI